MARSEKGRPRYRRLEVAVPQSGPNGIPEVLMRFHAAMLGMGRISAPENGHMYKWRAYTFEEAQAAIALLWRFIGPVNRAQAVGAMGAALDSYRTSGYRPRRSRYKRTVSPAIRASSPRSYTCELLDHAWAAGFLDAEGSFGCFRSMPRKNGPAWKRLRASADQHSEDEVPAEVLVHLQRALGGIGRIEPHGEADAFKWLAEGAPHIERVIALTAPWLGVVKSEQARAALGHFKEQPRLKGDAKRCVRGHAYDHSVVRGDRIRRTCNACARITSRERRAGRGIRPRQFKDIARRYTC